MSETRNQHFISQVEQRLNAKDPDAISPRIYEFEVVSKYRQVLRLTNPKGCLIAKTLSMLDLFSFDIDKDRGIRANFEQVFERYERQMRADTESILLAHSTNSNNVAREMFSLFVAKLINFIRNPFSVAKVVNTFGQFAYYHPTNPEIYESYIRTMNGRQPHQAFLCQKLGITNDQYKTWLRIIFMSLTPMADGVGNFLEDALKSLFEARDSEIFIHVHRYDDQRCLLSDRGFSSPVETHKDMVFDFNLCSNAFIRYIFYSRKIILPGLRPEMPSITSDIGPKPIRVTYYNNDLPALREFHSRAIEQAYAKVYCSGINPYSAEVLPLD